MHRFQLQSVVGEGAFAVVFKAQVLGTNEVIALKRFREKHYSWQAACGLPEIRALLSVRGQSNLIQILEMGRGEDGTVFFTSALEQGSLLNLLRERKSLGERLTGMILRQLLTGIGGLHHAGFIHRDLKPENILVSNKSHDASCPAFHVVLADLGSATKFEHGPMTEYITTRYYRSPEMVMKAPYGTKIDLWASGCILYEMLAGRPLFPAQGEGDLLLRMCAILGSPPLTSSAFSGLAQITKFHQPMIPSKFPKQSMRRWFEGTDLHSPSSECMSLLEKLVCWLPEDRINCSVALRTEPFLRCSA